MKVVALQTRWGPFINYCYLLVDKASGQAALVDPAWDYQAIAAAVDAAGVDLRYVLVTHAHFDHTNLAERFVNGYSARLVMSRIEHDDSGFGLPAGRYVHDGERLWLGSSEIVCLVTPGHTSGSTCFWWQGNLFTGDTLFPDGVGICESHAAASQLFDSVQRLLAVMEPATRIYAGHCFHVANGLSFERAVRTNIYLQIEKRESFCNFRMRPGQQGLFSFAGLACEG